MAALTLGSSHHAIVRNFIDYGYAPTHLQLCERFGVAAAAMTKALLFCVQQLERRWWGNCAWCALGVAALVGGNAVTIHTMLGAEGAPAVIHIDDHRVRENLVVHFPIPMTHAWDNVVYTCSTMLVFATDTDVDAWSQRHAILRGDVQPIQRVYDFARVWYGRHLEDEWRKWTADEARDLFEHFRFTGRIWHLPPSDQRF